MEHTSMLGALDHLGDSDTPVGAAARRLREALEQHMKYEGEFVEPNLMLLPAVVAGRITEDMRWAIANADRIRSEHDTLRRLHAAITDAAAELEAAAQAAGAKDTVGFARDVVADDLGDQEVVEPASVLVGDTIRKTLPPH
jgi:hypothetical protein